MVIFDDWVLSIPVVNSKPLSRTVPTHYTVQWQEQLVIVKELVKNRPHQVRKHVLAKEPG
jgi:hypothetical protein